MPSGQQKSVFWHCGFVASEQKPASELEDREEEFPEEELLEEEELFKDERELLRERGELEEEQYVNPATAARKSRDRASLSAAYRASKAESPAWISVGTRVLGSIPLACQ